MIARQSGREQHEIDSMGIDNSINASHHFTSGQRAGKFAARLADSDGDPEKDSGVAVSAEGDDGHHA